MEVACSNNKETPSQSWVFYSSELYPFPYFLLWDLINVALYQLEVDSFIIHYRNKNYPSKTWYEKLENLGNPIFGYRPTLSLNLQPQCFHLLDVWIQLLWNYMTCNVLFKENHTSQYDILIILIHHTMVAKKSRRKNLNLNWIDIYCHSKLYNIIGKQIPYSQKTQLVTQVGSGFVLK